MVLHRTIKLGNNLEVSFGIPDTKDELAEMFQLRHAVYVEEKGYIPKGQVLSGEDMDIHDRNHSCTYFIAKAMGKLIGTARIIQEIPLPTEKDYFDFETPNSIKNIPQDKRVEIGRIISRPRSRLGIHLPRQVVMTGLFSVMGEYGLSRGWMGGYGSIKRSAYKKFHRVGLPLHLVRQVGLKFNPSESVDTLKNFFSDNDPVLLVYFLSEEIVDYFDFLLNRSSLFRFVGGKTYLYLGDSLGLWGKIVLALKTIIRKLYAS